MKTSDVLINAKARFGRYGQNWTRYTLKRPGVFGENYCSIGAIHAVAQDWDPNRSRAKMYLEKAIAEEVGKPTMIDEYNDVGWIAGRVDRSDVNWHTMNPVLKVLAGMASLVFLAASMIPGVRLMRWRKIKKVWCRAIDMAVTDELQEEQQRQHFLRKDTHG